jgi:SAM-dependent methyltransferase
MSLAWVVIGRVVLQRACTAHAAAFELLTRGVRVGPERRASKPPRSEWEMSTTAQACEWVGYIDEEFAFDEFPSGSRVLDIGFGRGQQMRSLRSRGCRSLGLELDPTLARGGRESGLAVCRARAERLPVRTAAMDGVICKVVIPYTDESVAIGEVARVLRPGGTARISYHGPGYFLRYLLTDPNWKVRFYGLRAIVNTLYYRATDRRLPGFVGDTVFQTEQRLRRYYAKSGLDLVEARSAAAFAGAPVFIYHVLRRR